MIVEVMMSKMVMMITITISRDNDGCKIKIASLSSKMMTMMRVMVVAG